MSEGRNGWKTKLVASLTALVLILVGVEARITFGRIDSIGQTIARIAEGLGKVEASQAALDRRLDGLERRLAEMEKLAAEHGVIIEQLRKERK